MTEYLPQSFTHNHLAPLDLSSSKIESTTDLSSSSWQQAYPYPFYGDPLWSAQGNGGTVDFGDLESHGAMGISPSLLANIQEEDETGQPKQEDKVSQLPGSYDLEDPSLLNSSPFGTTFSDAGDGGDGGEEVDKEKGPEFWNRFDHEKSDTRSIPIPPITVVPSSNPFATRGRAKRGEQSSKSTPASTAATTTTTVTSTKRTNTTTRKSKGVTSAGVRKYQGGRRTEIDDMITRVMSRFNNSLKALTAKADKTQEEKEVGRILGNRDAAHLSRRKKNETITSLKSTNASLSLKLYQSQQSVQALTKMNEVQEKRMRLLEERVSFVEGFLGGGNGSSRVGAGHGMGSAGGTAAGGAAATAAAVRDGGELWPSTSGVSDVPADLSSCSWTDPVPTFSDPSYINPDMTLDSTLTTDLGGQA